jgi:geranylgeranyl pyrophosphate synthase/phage shock protein PspC (stress-responsive transcriptional regulator)
MTLATSRDVDRGVFGGVCAGFAADRQLSLRVVRALTVALSIVTGGLGALAYVALWLLLPSRADRATESPIATAATEALAHAVVAPSTPSAIASATPAQLYGPVADDLPLIDERLLSLANVEMPWLREMMQAMLKGGGKKMRPAMALLAGRYGTYNLEVLVPLATSVELLHTATLVHDDVIDEAAERRGNPTAAALFGNSASVMLGDYMFAHAAELIASTDNTRVVRHFARTLGRMAAGELQQDITAFEYSEDVERYMDRIGGKTASLFATAAEGGAIVTGASEEHIEALRHYGESLGMAFQIIDDLLDFTGNAEEMGKPIGSDLREGTITLPAIFYMQKHPGDNAVKRAFDDVDREQNFAQAIEEIRSSGALDEAAQAARRFGDRARAALSALPAGEEREKLDGLIDYVMERRS